MMPAVGKSGPLHELQNLCQLRTGIVNQRDSCIDDFGEIVRRNFRRHADGDSIGAIDEKVRNAGGKNVRLNLTAVIVGMKIDRIFIEIVEQRGCDLRQLRFRITIRGGRIAIDRAKISLTKNQRIPHRPGLGEAHQSVIHREVAMRMVLAHHFADDTGALARQPDRAC